MEQKFFEEVLNKLKGIADLAYEHMLSHQHKEEQEDDCVKRMLYLPGREVFFLTMKESDELLHSFDEMGIIPILKKKMYLVFDEDHVVEHKGERYVAGPMLVRTDFDPECELDLTMDEIRTVFDLLEANEEEIAFGGVSIPVLALR